jgi:glycosyltransferase involved in cell wall biosynthesis
MSPKVSVVIPAYNHERFIQAAVDSVLAQTHANLELIVVDDGSTDQTQVLLKRLAAGARIPIRVLRQDNRGAAAARNLGIRMARGSLLAFLDSDDWWLPGKLAVQAAAMEAQPELLISHTREIWHRNGQRVNQKKKHDPPDGDVFAASLGMCVVGMSTVVARRQFFDRYGLFDEDLPCCEDYDLWLRAGSREPFLLAPQPLTGKEGGRPDQLSEIHRMGMDVFRIRSLGTLLDSGVLTPAQQQATRIELIRKCLIYGQGCVKHGRPEEGARYLALAQLHQSTGKHDF